MCICLALMKWKGRQKTNTCELTKDQKNVQYFCSRFVIHAISYAHCLPVHLSTKPFRGLWALRAIFLRKKEHNKCANKIDIYDEIKRNGSQYDKHFSIHVLQGNNDYNKRCLLAPHSLSLCSRGTSERGLDVFLCVWSFFSSKNIKLFEICRFIFLF